MSIRSTLLFLLIWLMGCGSQNQTVSCNAAIATGSPEATEVGHKILQRGGNAADAVVAISFMLGVTEPAMSGIGGGCQIVLSIPGQPPLAINGTTLAPAATNPNLSKKELTPYTKSTIPSMVKTMAFLHKQYGSGTISWKELVTPAIKVAEEGFVVGEFRGKVYQEYGSKLLAGDPILRQWLTDGSHLPAMGDTVKQPILANTLRRLAEHGAEDFYTGGISKQIANDMKSHGGWITEEDLRLFPDPQVVSTLKSSYHAHEIYTAPPPAGGSTMLTALALMEGISSKKPLLNKLEEQTVLISALQKAHHIRSVDPLPQLNYQWEFDHQLKRHTGDSILSSPLDFDNAQSGETTHYSVVDNQAMAVAVTASINAYFGSGAASPDLGFLYNSYMTDFIFNQPDHYYALGPGKPAYSSMSPTVVRKNNKDVLVLGSPGSKRIISAVAQVVHYWITEKSSLEGILAIPRIHALDSVVWLEAEDSLLIKALTDQGYSLKGVNPNLSKDHLNAFFGGIHAISRRDKQWQAAADPRRDGKAIASD